MSGQPYDPKAWAYALRDREIWQAKNPRLVSRHEALTPAQRRMWRSALGLSDFAPAEPVHSVEEEATA